MISVSPPVPPGWSSERLPAHGVQLHVVAGGPANGRPILLLHGFPEGWWTWRRQLAPLAEAGLRVIAPDLRGYGGSDAPRGFAHYRLDLLAEDVVAVARSAGAGRFHLVGHDWGGIVAWAVAARHPERVERLSILNAPHLDAVRPVMRRHPGQMARSLYIAFFQLGGLAEAALRVGDHALLKRMMRATAHPDTFAPGELDAGARAWSRPGRLTAMLDYYRALVRMPAPPLGRIAVPTQILWGVRDRALSFPLAEASLALCDRGTLVRFDRASHWLPHDEPDAVAEALIRFGRGDAGP